MMDKNYKFTIALIYDFDGTLSAGNMQEYNFIPAIGKSNKEFWSEANDLAEAQDAGWNAKADDIRRRFGTASSRSYYY